MKQILHRVNSLIVHPKDSNYLRSHLRAIMALDHSRLGLENNFLAKKSGRTFCVRQVYFIKSCQQIWWRVTVLLYFLYITSEVKQYTMRGCFYHTGLGQNAVFHNFARQMALIQYSGHVCTSIELRFNINNEEFIMFIFLFNGFITLCK